eukprot:963542-Amphidinium_carterae.1
MTDSCLKRKVHIVRSNTLSGIVSAEAHGYGKKHACLGMNGALNVVTWAHSAHKSHCPVKLATTGGLVSFVDSLRELTASPVDWLIPWLECTCVQLETDRDTTSARLATHHLFLLPPCLLGHTVLYDGLLFFNQGLQA